MAFLESTKIVYSRIHQLEPELGRKIMGYLLLQESEEKLAQFAYFPDTSIQELINTAKADLPAFLPISLSLNTDSIHVSDISPQFLALSPIPTPTSSTVRDPGLYSDGSLTDKHGLDSMTLDFSNTVNQLNNQTQLLGIEEHEDCNGSGKSPFCYGDAASGNFNMRAGRRLVGVPEFPVKVCHFFNKGICRNGSNCRYFHGDLTSDHIFGGNSVDFGNEDHVLSPGSLQELELEIVEILRARKGDPVSIASLPMIYFEKYGKVLQAEGYLTESQRHGKAGYSLTRLLARLRYSIRLIDRPHGQHAIILAEDASRYLENCYNRNDLGPIVSGSTQIYLTFPAESAFTKLDVSHYFSTFGKVEEVRIPCLHERMYGFVTFASADTVRTILAKKNPHFVCGFRVLVKPYREKAKPLERKYRERRDSSITRGFESPRMLRKQFLEEQLRAFEFERRQNALMNLVHETVAKQSHFGYSMDVPNFPEGTFDDDGHTNDEKEGHTGNNIAPESEALELPENPFAIAAVSSISTDI